MIVPEYVHQCKRCNRSNIQAVYNRIALSKLVCDIYGKNTEMEQFIGIKYRLKSSTDNFESYLKFINVGYISRKAALAVTPVTVLTKDNDVYTLTVTTTLKTITIVFKVGEEFQEERADGVTVKSVMTIEGNKLIQTQIEENGNKSLHVREFTPDLLTVTTTADGWEGTCIRVYERV